VYVQKISTLVATVTRVLAASGPFNGALIALFQNDIYPVRTNVFGDFTYGAIGGIAATQAITWGTPFVNGNQQAQVQGGLIDFLTTTNPTDPITAYGYVIFNAVPDDWILAERFAVPFTFTAAGQYLGIVPRLIYDT
jgi:hypothetical protein